MERKTQTRVWLRLVFLFYFFPLCYRTSTNQKKRKRNHNHSASPCSRRTTLDGQDFQPMACTCCFGRICCDCKKNISLSSKTTHIVLCWRRSSWWGVAQPSSWRPCEWVLSQMYGPCIARRETHTKLIWASSSQICEDLHVRSQTFRNTSANLSHRLFFQGHVLLSFKKKSRKPHTFPLHVWHLAALSAVAMVARRVNQLVATHSCTFLPSQVVCHWSDLSCHLLHCVIPSCMKSSSSWKPHTWFLGFPSVIFRSNTETTRTKL